MGLGLNDLISAKKSDQERERKDVETTVKTLVAALTPSHLGDLGAEDNSCALLPLELEPVYTISSMMHLVFGSENSDVVSFVTKMGMAKPAVLVSF